MYPGRLIIAEGVDILNGMAYLLLSVTVSSYSSQPTFEPILFMDAGDVEDSWGLLYPLANQVVASPTLRPPPLNYTAGKNLY